MVLSTHENSILLEASKAVTYRITKKKDTFTINWQGNYQCFTGPNLPCSHNINLLKKPFGKFYTEWFANIQTAMRNLDKTCWDSTMRTLAGYITVRSVVAGLGENEAVGMLSPISSADVLSDNIKVDILEYLPVGVYFIDYDYRIQWTNHLGTCQSHINWKENYGNLCYKDPFGLGSPCKICPVSQTFKDGQTHTLERKMPNGDTWLISSIPAVDGTGRQIGAIETVIDVSEIAADRERSWQLLTQQQNQLAAQLDAIKQLHRQYIKEGYWLLDSPEVVTETMARTMQCDSVRFWLRDDKGITLLDQFDADKSEHFVVDFECHYMLEFFNNFISGQGQILISDITKAGLPADVVNYYLDNKVQSLLISPLTNNKELLGFLTAAHFKPREWKVDEQSFAMSLADAVVLSLNQQRLVEKQRQLDTLMANLPGVAFRMRYDANGPKLEYVSEGSKGLTGFSMHDVEQNQYILKQVIFADDYQAYHQAHTGLQEKDAALEILFRIDLGQGNLRWVLERSKVIATDKDDGALVFEGFAHDISERMKLKEAELASEAKTNFLAAMSHEIRTPLNAIIGFTHFISQTKMTKRQAEYLQKIDTSANILLELINTILDFSKIEAGKMEVLNEPFSLDNLLRGLEAIFDGQLTQKGLSMTITTDGDIPKELLGSPLHLKQILINLLSNAVKFTEQGSISVKCELADIKDGLVTLKFIVSDTGIGMEPEDLAKVFNAFVQADDSVSRKHGGTGLGLAIVKSLVELMQGEIYVKSEPGKGTTFTFTCRVYVNTAPVWQVTTGKYQAPRFKSQTVLLVEDNEINREIAQTMLEDVNLKVTMAEDGQKALDILQSSPPGTFSLILMDIQMPVMDGLQATRHIRLMPDMENIPILAMTAHALDTEKKKSEAAGMNGHLSKPIELQNFYGALAQYLEQESPTR